MSVLEIPAPVGAVVPSAPVDLRGPVEAAGQRFSSPAARTDGDVQNIDATTELAAQLGASERALRTANGMLQRHLAPSGEGQAGQVTARVGGMRRACLLAPGLMARGRTAELSVGVALLADPLVLLAVGGAERVLHWSLMPGGPSVTARADALRFLRALATGGQLIFQMGNRAEFPPLDVDGSDWEFQDEWHLFEDLATLEEWSGATIPMPEEVSARDATAAAQAASWARTRQVPAQLTDAITFATNEELKVGQPDELRLHQDLGVELLGTEIPLGEAIARIKLDQVELEEAAEGDGRTYRAQPAESDITLWLRPPPGRRTPPHRTQPDLVSAPERANRGQAAPRVKLVRRARASLSDVSQRHGLRRLRQAPDTRSLLNDLRGD